MSWSEYVRSHLAGRNQQTLAATVGVSQTAVSRWLSGKQGVDAAIAVDFARAVGDTPLAALVAAGFLTSEEAKARPTLAPDYSLLSNDQLIDLVRSRMVDADASLAARADITASADVVHLGGGDDGGDTAATKPSQVRRNQVTGRIQRDSRAPQGYREVMEVEYDRSRADFMFLQERYLAQAGGDPREAKRLLEHDGPAGANVTEDVWDAALRALNEEVRLSAPIAPAAREVGRPGKAGAARRRQDEVEQGSQDDGGMEPA